MWSFRRWDLIFKENTLFEDFYIYLMLSCVPYSEGLLAQGAHFYQLQTLSIMLQTKIMCL